MYNSSPDLECKLSLAKLHLKTVVRIRKCFVNPRFRTCTKIRRSIYNIDEVLYIKKYETNRWKPSLYTYTYYSLSKSTCNPEGPATLQQQQQVIYLMSVQGSSCRSEFGYRR